MATHQPHFTPDVPENLDEWHVHTPAEGPPQHEHASNINAAVLGASLIAIVVSVTAVIGVIAVYFKNYTDRLIAERRETPLAGEFLQMQAADRATLSGYSWADPARGVVVIPIEQAMRKVAARYAGGS